MNATAGTRRVSFSDRPLLLADVHRADRDGVDQDSGFGRHRGVDVVVLDLCEVEPASVQPWVAAATGSGQLVGVRAGSASAVDAALQCGVSLVVLDWSWSDPAIKSIVDTGVVVVLPAVSLDAASGRSILLITAGVDLERVVFEVAPAQAVGQLEAIARASEGWRVGVCLAPGDGSPAHVGWEMGVLTVALSQGVATVRGVDPRRYRRICSVLDALNGLESVS